MPPPRPHPDAIPAAPGVYRFVGSDGRVLYVGKAKNLRARVLSYFREDLAARTSTMVQTSASLGWVVCSSETEALILEREWISALQPPYNIRLREGGGYSGVWVSVEADVPRLGVWRGRRPADVEVFGPYPQVRSRELLDALTLTFGVRTCSDTSYRRALSNGRACLLAETGHCRAPCVGRVSLEAHRAEAEDLVRYLRRPDTSRQAQLETEMRSYADAENFEAAARRRDQVSALSLVGRAQRVVGPGGWDRQAVAVRRGDGYVGVAGIIVRDGVVSEAVLLESIDDPERSNQDITTLAVTELTSRQIFNPDKAVLSLTGGAATRSARGKRERDVVAFAATQAEQARIGASSRPWGAPEERHQGLAELAERLEVSGPLRRIECIDVSHTRGRDAVGSLVTLIDGVADGREFRHVRLGNTRGDDYAAIAEVVRRRFSGRHLGLSDMPDLLLIDGGAGQISSASAVLAELGVNVAHFGLAKRFEHVWPPGAVEPVIFDDGSVALRILQHARDQAHRSALGAHRRNRERSASRTRLEDIRGVGPVKRRALLDRFGTLDAVAAASVDDLASTAGIGAVLATMIHSRFHPEQP